MGIADQIRDMVEPLLDVVSTRSPRRALGDLADKLLLRTRHEVPVFYDPAYRLPFASFEAIAGVEPRRADFVAWFLLERNVIGVTDLRAPRRAIYADLARVHGPALLESLGKRETLASIYAVDASDVPVDETLNTVRLACGGTLDAARVALRTGGQAVNLLGGFHHAAPNRAAGMCPVNDMAVAVAALRSEGFRGQVVIIDLDAHPPDGTAECFNGDSTVWIGSLSGSKWDGLFGADETVLPEGCNDETYLGALQAMLSRMPPKPSLAFVIAGGDVLANDRFGKLGLTLDGARQRDLAVAEALEGVPSVWLPGGGYHRNAWKIPAGTVLALTRKTREPIPENYDPLRARYKQVWQSFGQRRHSGEFSFSAEDIEDSLRLHGSERYLLLGHYTAEGIEFALHHCGILAHLQRLGYGHFKVEVDEASPGERLRLFGESEGVRHLLIEVVLERKKKPTGAEVLYIHWLTLRNPKAAFSERRPQLPGQELPGLGLARESEEMLARLARELGMAGVAYRPAWFHMAYAARYHFRYVDPERQGRFEAMLRDLKRYSLREVTLAFAQGRIRMNGQPYPWESEEMVYWLGKHRREDRRTVEAERARAHFTLVPASGKVGASAGETNGAPAT
ncbi:MAG TPA: histone deacetylase [Myxococcales bacterium]|jgi:acetoin utilization deacetylase AcuC-like enzyme